MANQNRLAKSYLAELIEDDENLHKQGFSPLIRYLEANAPLSARVGYSISPKQDFARFGQAPLLHFFPAAFKEVKRGKNTGNLKLKNSYWGMLGINGPLPHHLTEYALERNFRHQDDTFNEFLDVFNHRFISLFYRAWADAEPTVSHDRPEQDRFLQNLASFAGQTNTQSHTFDKQQTNPYLAGLLSQKNSSATTLAQVLSEHLQLAVTISEFEGRWYPLEAAEQTQLGQKNCQLGSSALIGNRTFQRCFNFAINIGPVDYDDYISLINNKQQLQNITHLTHQVVGQEYEFTIRIQLKPQQTKACRLGSAKLGINSWSQSKLGHLQQCDPITVYQVAS